LGTASFSAGPVGFASGRSANDSYTTTTIFDPKTAAAFYAVQQALKTKSNKMGFFGEFLEFAVKGNLLDMATGIIIGAAFGTVIKSLVDDIILPPIGLALGNVDFSQLKVVLKDADADDDEVAIRYGLFINSVIAFFIIACVVFVLVKSVNNVKKRLVKEEAAAAAEANKQEELLTDIRDLLAKSAGITSYANKGDNKGDEQAVF
jgi:large conductance mechanosensitive channel